MGELDDVRRISDKVRAMIRAGKVDASSAVALIRAVGDACKASRVKQASMADVVEAVVVEIAKGQDGVLGTADDLISANVLNILTSLIQNQLVRELASWAVEMSWAARLARLCSPAAAWCRCKA